MIRLLVDTHTHTISSGHAYSTVYENAKVAAEKGLEMIAVTDHGPAMEGAPTHLHFLNLRVLPEEIHGVRILKGAEVNIVDYDGNVDLKEKPLSRLDFVLASLHEICIKPLDTELNTNAIVNALKSPFIDAVGHPGNPVFPVDKERIVRTAAEYGKFIEINNHSFIGRKGSEQNCREFVRLCKKHGVKVVCGSDAHYCQDVGRFTFVETLLSEENMPQELIMNVRAENFEHYLEKKRNQLQALA